jgi:hypothetical protein
MSLMERALTHEEPTLACDNGGYDPD